MSDTPATVTLTITSDQRAQLLHDAFRANPPTLFTLDDLARFFGRAGKPLTKEAMRRRIRRQGLPVLTNGPSGSEITRRALFARIEELQAERAAKRP